MVGGGVVGFLFGGPLGAAAGVVTPLVVIPLKSVLSDIAERWLSSRETVRVSAGASYAILKIKEHLDTGDKIREDAFFEDHWNGLSTAEELFEATLLKCKNEAEERKCRFTANIFANALFTAEMTPSTIVYVLQRAERLTYRQLCLLALVKRATEVGYETSPWGTVLSSSQEHNDQTLVAEVRELTGLIHAMGNSEIPPYFEPLGQILYEAMSLNEIPYEDLREVAEALFV